MPSSLAHGFDARQSAPGLECRTVGVAAHRKLHHMMSAQAVDQIRRRAFGNDLAVIDDGETVAKALGFVHVMRGEQHGPARRAEIRE